MSDTHGNKYEIKFKWVGIGLAWASLFWAIAYASVEVSREGTKRLEMTTER